MSQLSHMYVCKFNSVYRKMNVHAIRGGAVRRSAGEIDTSCRERGREGGREGGRKDERGGREKEKEGREGRNEEY